jgi:hypothetical protein
MTVADDLRVLVNASKAVDTVSQAHVNLSAKLTEMAKQGYTNTSFVFPLEFSTGNKEALIALLEADGLTVIHNSVSGFLEISW